MSDMIHEQDKPERKHDSGFRLVIPFFVVMALLTVVSFIIPLRPTVSYSEMRELAKFPEFSLSALTSGSYFDDITTWFSDTFPGREQWLEVSSHVSTYYGYSEISIEGSLEPVSDEIPVAVEATTIPKEVLEETTQQETVTIQEPSEETEPAPTQWGGVDAGEDAEISLGTAIQIGDSGFNQLGFSQQQSDRYISILNKFAEDVKDKGVRVISAPAPTAVGIMIEPEYLEKLNCAPQDEMMNYLHSGMSDDIVTVDTFSHIVKHNDEYIYFRTDHHWTALGAYYAYEAFCETLGLEAEPLENFEVWDQGTFEGTLYGKVSKPQKLRADTLYAYVPQWELSMLAYNNNGYGKEMPVLQDMTKRQKNEKYLTFISGEYAMVEITNDSIPDAPNCVVVRDSFANCFIPYLTKHYHKVYAIDYRKYRLMGLTQYVEEYDIQDVIFAPYLIATQAIEGNDFFENRCR